MPKRRSLYDALGSRSVRSRPNRYNVGKVSAELRAKVIRGLVNQLRTSKLIDRWYRPPHSFMSRGRFYSTGGGPGYRAAFQHFDSHKGL